MRALNGDEERAGPYTLLAELGAGGMGRVYLASGPDGSLVAVKRIEPRFVDDEGFRTRFAREVDACRRVSGAYTAAVVAADSEASRPWLASVFVPGPSLAEALDAVGTLPEQPVLQLAARLATALADIHRAGLVHRDLKPSNVLLADDGLRVIDFGIVRAVQAGGEQTLTTLPLGSPAYMSPEQAQAYPVTTASDLFSLGILLTVASTGRNPFHVPGNIEASLRNIVRAQPDLTGVPARLRPVVERCLAKDPADRPTPTQVLALLGPVAPTSRPWPSAVYDQIARRRAEVDRLLGGSPPEGTQVLAAGPSFEPAVTKADGPPEQAPPAPARRSPSPVALWVGVGVAVLALAAAFVYTMDWDRLGDAIDRLTAGTTPEQEQSDSSSPSQESSEQPAERTGPILGLEGRCLDVNAGNSANGTAVDLYPCNGTAAQQWTVESDGTIRAFGKCMGVSGARVDNGTLVELWDCNGDANQHWTARDGQLVDGNSGRCLDQPFDWSTNTASWQQLQIWDCGGGDNQKWQLPS